MNLLVLGGTGSVSVGLVVEKALKRRQSDETAHHALA